MTLPAHALVSLAEMKAYVGETGSAEDEQLELAIKRASSMIESEGVGGRRLIYRGPVEDDDAIVELVAIANGSLSLDGQPDSEGRTLVVTKQDADRSLTAGTLTVTGTVGGSAGVTEAFDLSLANVLHGVKFFTAVSAADISGAQGQTSADQLKLGTSVGYTELYSPCGLSPLIRPMEWPIQNVIAVNEDADRVFGSSTALTEGTHFEIRSPYSIRRALARIDDSLDYAWIAGRRVVQARLSAGYRTSAEVPDKLKGVCLELGAWFHQHRTRKEWGLSTRSDGLGSVTRSGPPMITSGLGAALGSYFRAEAMPTAERDFDLEAA